ncbi:MAG: hypothetical protein E7159_01810 [Firmicutes bacterium]|nr:hypothetical protein [Bacillota bacterium]
MNIIFEGIGGSGKTTLIKDLCKKLDNKNIEYELIGDLKYETPIRQVLLDMVQEAPLMNGEKKFKTGLYESLLLAANHHYVQEKLRDSNKICIYDRDFISLLSYQKEILKADYEDYEEIYSIYRKLVLFNLKKVDYIVHLITSYEECIRRASLRDNREFSIDDIRMLKAMNQNMKDEIKLIDNGHNIIRLNGEDCVDKNSSIILERIREN